MVVLQIQQIININSMDESESLKQQLERANKKIVALEAKIAGYECNGPAKLFYSLNRKQWEMADLMNREALTEIEIDDPKSKTFDRLKVIWKDAADLATAVNALGFALGITGDEDKDTSARRRTTTPESISDVLGNTAGQHT